MDSLKVLDPEGPIREADIAAPKNATPPIAIRREMGASTTPAATCCSVSPMSPTLRLDTFIEILSN
jgi:hypothetical protein